MVYDEQNDDKHILSQLIMNCLTRTYYRRRGSEVHCIGSSRKSDAVLASESRQAVTSIVSDEVAANTTILTRIRNAGIEEQFTVMTLWHKWKK